MKFAIIGRMKRSLGFTVIELVTIIAFVGVAATLLLVQKGAINAAQRDSQRKTAINAMYYNLEEVYYAKNTYYPAKIDSDTLKAMDPTLFTDPNGIKMNEANSDYHYEATNCDNDKCKGYRLHTSLEKEADYVKTSRNS